MNNLMVFLVILLMPFILIAAIFSKTVREEIGDFGFLIIFSPGAYWACYGAWTLFEKMIGG